MKSGKRISFDRINENINVSLFVLRIWICILNRSCHFLFRAQFINISQISVAYVIYYLV